VLSRAFYATGTIKRNELLRSLHKREDPSLKRSANRSFKGDYAERC
jgi:hypothetical protein